MFTRGILAGLIAAGALLAQRPRPGLDTDLASFDQVWTTVRDWQKLPVASNWEAMRAQYRPRVEKSASRDEARAAMQEMLGQLHQTHFGIVSSSIYASLDDSGILSGAGVTGIDSRVAAAGGAVGAEGGAG